MVMRRAFNRKEKAALYLVGGGVCQICGVELTNKNYHADHIQPYSKKGLTDVVNGQALCDKCNLFKSNKTTMKQFNEHKWQKEARIKIESNLHLKRHFLIEASVGSGKTLFGGNVLKNMFESYGFDNVVIVAPSVNLRKGWADELFEWFGIQIDYDWNMTCGWQKPAVGVSLTYHSINTCSLLLRKLITDRTVVILDEIHHIGDNKSWGAGIKSAFENAGLVIGLSATPFRQDDAYIPFVEYKSNDDGLLESVSDYSYPYWRAVKDDVVRPVSFEIFGGKAEWKEGEYTYYGQANPRLLERDQKKILRALTDSIGRWTIDTFKEANDKLQQLRKEALTADSAGLIVCNNRYDAENTYKAIKAMGVKCKLVISSDDDLDTKMEDSANTIIDNFKNSSDEWIVAVRMISEGVNIPRIRVILYSLFYILP